MIEKAFMRAALAVFLSIYGVWLGLGGVLGGRCVVLGLVGLLVVVLGAVVVLPVLLAIASVLVTPTNLKIKIIFRHSLYYNKLVKPTNSLWEPSQPNSLSFEPIWVF